MVSMTGSGRPYRTSLMWMYAAMPGSSQPSITATVVAAAVDALEPQVADVVVEDVLRAGREVRERGVVGRACSSARPRAP